MVLANLLLTWSFLGVFYKVPRASSAPPMGLVYASMALEEKGATNVCQDISDYQKLVAGMYALLARIIELAGSVVSARGRKDFYPRYVVKLHWIIASPSFLWFQGSRLV